MIVFYVAAAVMTLIAIAIVTPPLLKKSQPIEQDDSQRLTANLSAAEDRLKQLKSEHEAGSIDEPAYQRAREDIEKNLALDLDRIEQPDQHQPAASSPVMAIAVTLMVPLLAGFLYLTLGSPSAIDNTTTNPEQAVATQQPNAADIDAMVAGLAERLKNEPDNVEGWFRLAQSYLVLGRFDESIAAAKKVRELSNDDPAALLLHASAMSGAKDGEISGEIEQLVLAVVKVRPENPQALWMAGMGARQRNDRIGAIEYWNRLLPLLEPQPEQQQELRTLIATTEAEIAQSDAQSDTQSETGDNAQDGTNSETETPMASSTVAAETGTANNTADSEQSGAAATNDESAATKVLKVSVNLDASLIDQTKPEHSVFIFARALDGPPMPLAVVRASVADLPVTVQLDDSSAMLPAMTLSKFEQVFVGARISASGDAIGQSGDLEGSLSPVYTSETGEISITIDSVRP